MSIGYTMFAGIINRSFPQEERRGAYNAFYLMVVAIATWMLICSYFLSNKVDPLDVIMSINNSDIRLSIYSQWKVSRANVRQLIQEAVRNYFQASSHEDLVDTLKKNPSWLEYVPVQTEELALVAIAADPSLIQSNSNGENIAFLHRAVRANPDVILYLRHGHLIRYSSHHYHHLYPDNDLTIELWEIAVSLKADLFLKAPRQTHTMVLSAVKQNPSLIHRIQSIEMQEKIRAQLRMK